MPLVSRLQLRKSTFYINIFKFLSLKTQSEDTIYIRNHLFEVVIAGGRKALATRNSSISVCVVVLHTYQKIAGTAMSKPLTPWQRGCSVRTAKAYSGVFSIHRLRLRNERSLRSKGGFWESLKTQTKSGFRLPRHVFAGHWV